MASSRIKRTNSFSSYVAAINKDVKDLQAQANPINGVAAGAITGDNLSGTTELGTNTIQSSNYAEGLTGWKIDGTGVAEFSDVFVRGDINAYSGTIGYWNISNPGVERNIGSKRLFGTFIESDNLGDTDLNDELGVYVGLYRSYREPSVSISGVYRKDDIAIVISPNHGYKNGDKVTVAINGTATYETRSFTIINKELTSGTAILTLSEIHDFRAGDTVVVSGVDETFDGTWTAIDSSSSLKTVDYTIRFLRTSNDISSTSVSDSSSLVKRTVSETGFSFSTGPANVRVIEADHNSFRYENTGPNVDFQYSNLFTGTASIYDENVAGLYLNDYSKALFDHGYFSNEGINYVSAQTFNLVHNPSFEYLNENQEETASSSGWSTDTGLGLSAINIADLVSAKSTYGGAVVWDTVSTDKYLKGTVNYSLMESSVRYGRIIYLDLDVYSNPVSYAITPTEFVLSGDASYITVTSDGDHGLKAGDWVFSESVGTDPNDRGHLVEFKDLKALDDADKYRRVVQVSTVPSSSTFTVKVFGRAPGTPMSAVNQKIFKISKPAFDLSDIKFKFGNGETVGLYDILDDSTKANWAINKILTLSPDEIDQRLYFQGTTLRSESLPNLSVIDANGFLKNNKSIEYFRLTYAIKINSSKLYQKYKDLDSSSLQSKFSFQILIPGWIKNTVGDITTTSYYIDSVMLSSQNKFFYGGSKYGNQSWYDSTAIPNTPSIQAPKTWIDIDLNAQTSRINYVDDLRFSTPGFSASLMSSPGIANDISLDPYAIIYGYNDDDATGTELTSGRYQKALMTYSPDTQTLIPQKLVSKDTDNALITYESNLITSTSLYDTYIQLTSLSQYTSATDGEIASTYASMIALNSNEVQSEITISADYLYFRNSNSWSMPEGNRAPLSIDFDAQVTMYGRSYSDFYEIEKIERTAPDPGTTTSEWTITLLEAISADAMSSIWAIELDSTQIVELNSSYSINSPIQKVISIPGSTTQIKIQTDNVTQAVADVDTLSNGGYISVFSEVHPRIYYEALPLDDASENIATTSWVNKKILEIGSGNSGGSYQHIFVDVATIEALPALDYSNGSSGVGATLTMTTAGVTNVDGYDLNTGDIVLVKDQADDFQNGVYKVDVAGTTGLATKLIRVDFYDGSTQGQITKGDLIYIGTSSATLAGRAYINDTVGTITVGTTAISFAAFSGGGGGGGTYTGIGAVDISTGNEISLKTGYVKNTDTDDFARLWVGTTTPTGAFTGDVWIQVPA